MSQTQEFALTEQAVRMALAKCSTLIEEICMARQWSDGTGPCGAVIDIYGKGLELPFISFFGVIPRDPAAQEERYHFNFSKLAEDKRKLAQREGMPTDEIRKKHPYLLQSGDCLYGGGYSRNPNLAVGVSGLTEEGDREIAELVHEELIEQCRQLVKTLYEGANEDNKPAYF